MQLWGNAFCDIIAFYLGILNICLPVFHLVVDSGEVSAAEVGLKYVTLLSINFYGLYSSLKMVK